MPEMEDEFYNFKAVHVDGGWFKLLTTPLWNKAMRGGVAIVVGGKVEIFLNSTLCGEIVIRRNFARYWSQRVSSQLCNRPRDAASQIFCIDHNLQVFWVQACLVKLCFLDTLYQESVNLYMLVRTFFAMTFVIFLAQKKFIIVFDLQKWQRLTGSKISKKWFS